MNLQAQARVSIFKSLLHLGPILLAGRGSIGATSKVLSSTILTYHAEHLVSYVGLQTAIPY
jgi:hypothetical protein